MRLDSQNPLGYLIGAEAAFSLGMNDKGLELVKSGARAPNFNNYATEFSLDIRNAWKSLGYDPLEAKLMSRQCGTEVYAVAPIQRAAKCAWEVQTKDGSEDSKLAASTGQLNIISLFQLRPGQTSNAWYAQQQILEINLLGRLPKDAEYGETGQTVGDRWAALCDSQNSRNKFLNEAITTLDKATPAQVEEFWAREDQLGDVAAATWLKSQQ